MAEAQTVVAIESKPRQRQATPVTRLRRAAREAIDDNPGQFAEAVDQFLEAIRGDADLIWTLAEAQIHKAGRDYINALFQETDGKVAVRSYVRSKGAEEKDGGHSDHDAHNVRVPVREPVSPPAPARINRGPTAIERAAAMQTETRIAKSVLSWFRVGDRAIGDMTAGEARTVALKYNAHAKFINVLTAGLADPMVIGEYVKPDEADAAFRSVMAGE